MNCCVRCFNDLELQDIIKGNKIRGKCDFCGNSNVYICDINDNEAIKENFERLIDIYTPVSNLDETFPKEKSDMLKNILAQQWSIFKLPPDKIYSFLIRLLPEKYKEEPKLFDDPVGIKGSIQNEYLHQYSMLGIAKWEDFVNEIKTESRFHTKLYKRIYLKKCLEPRARSIKQIVCFIELEFGLIVKALIRAIWEHLLLEKQVLDVLIQKGSVVYI